MRKDSRGHPNSKMKVRMKCTSHVQEACTLYIHRVTLFVSTCISLASYLRMNSRLLWRRCLQLEFWYLARTEWQWEVWLKHYMDGHEESWWCIGLGSALGAQAAHMRDPVFDSQWMLFFFHLFTSYPQMCSQLFFTGSKVLASPFPRGTVHFGGSNVPFGSATKETMCPLAPPQNQHIFNSHLNYLNLKTVWAPNMELSKRWTQLKCFVDSGTPEEMLEASK